MSLEEAVEVVEAQAGGPVGERAGGAGVPVGDVVVLATVSFTSWFINFVCFF